VNLETVRAAVTHALEPAGARWLHEVQRQIGADPAALGRLIPAVTRHCDRGPLQLGADSELFGWTIADGVRALLLVGADIDAVTAVYRYGETAQRRAVLRALPLLDLGDRAVPLVLEAVRNADTSLIAAAMGPYAAEHLPLEAWRHAVLKCVVLGVPLAWVADLQRRTDDELVRMVRAFAEERLAADRPVSLDVRLIIADLPAADKTDNAATVRKTADPTIPNGPRNQESEVEQ
jgi:hypothetical protein